MDLIAHSQYLQRLHLILVYQRKWHLKLQHSLVVVQEKEKYAVLYLGLVLFNRRQPAVLRLLAGATGVMPALTAAAALALCASYLFRPWPLPAAGVMSAAGAMLAFLCDELITIKNLGGIRLKYYSIWVCLLLVGGYFLMLLGAWVNTPIM